MNSVEALELVKQVCSEVHTNLTGHQNIQQALQAVEKECSRIDPPDPTEPKEPDGNTQ